MSSFFHIPTEGLEDGHQYFEDACNVFVGQLLVLNFVEGLAGRRKGSHDVGDYSIVCVAVLVMDCV